MITYDEAKKLFNYKDGKLYWARDVNKAVKAGALAGGFDPTVGYWRIKYKYIFYYRHRLIYLLHHGYFPENFIDHINQNKVDDRIENLREVSAQCNQRNCGNPINNKSGVKGVCWHKNLKIWQANVRVNDKGKWLGNYKDFDEAVLARYAGEQCLNWRGCDSNSPARKYALAHGLIKK